MKNVLIGAALLASAATHAKPTVDIAILLDTSGSMQGLINQVRDGLWQTLNNLGEIKKDGEKADLRLALYEYGSGVVPAESGFIQMLSPLTTDHTLIAEKLFATKAQGGTEYSGQAISMATGDLKWSQKSEDFRAIVIAGNETIHQGEIKPLEASANALDNDILVNSIFAGSQTITPGGGFGCFGHFGHCPPPTTTPDPELNPIFREWQQLAQVGGGETLNIDHNNSIPHVASPYDDRIIEVTEEISTTYLPFGPNGADEYTRMLDLDRQIRNSGNGSYMGWGDYRSGNFGQSTTATWDLVTAYRGEEFDISSITEADLPESLRGLSLEEKLTAVDKVEKERTRLEKLAEELREKRRLFVEEELRNRQDEGETNFAEAIHQIIVKQIRDKGFTL